MPSAAATAPASRQMRSCPARPSVSHVSGSRTIPLGIGRTRNEFGREPEYPREAAPADCAEDFRKRND